MEQKNNTGAIFKNDYKKTESHPDYKGKALIDGVEKEVALWLNESKSGTKYFSAKFSKPYQAEVEAGGNEDAKTNIREGLKQDDLPFQTITINNRERTVMCAFFIIFVMFVFIAVWL